MKRENQIRLIGYKRTTFTTKRFSQQKPNRLKNLKIEKTMETKLKDVLHLYLGCFVMNGTNKNTRVNGIDGAYCHTQIGKRIPKRVLISQIKPILRAFSDLTEVECEMVGVHFPSLESWAGKAHREKWSAEEFRYLLQQKIDLFGLIKSQQAIDKNSLKNR